ncbi:2932_t:CDS:2, partial [Funneliformis caledonium]
IIVTISLFFVSKNWCDGVMDMKKNERKDYYEKKPVRLDEKRGDLFQKFEHDVRATDGNFLASVETLSYKAFRTEFEIDLLGTYNICRNPKASYDSAAKAGIDALSKNRFIH